MDTGRLFQELSDDGNYSGPCNVTFENPWGHITGEASIHLLGGARAEIEVSITAYEMDPACGECLMGLLNAELPRREDNKLVYTFGASSEERQINSISVETPSGKFSATSGFLTHPFLDFGNERWFSLVLNDLVFSALTDAKAMYWLIPLQGPFGECYLGRPSSPHPIVLNGGSYLPFSAEGSACGLQIFDPDHKPRHSLTSYDAIVFGQLAGTAETLVDMLAALPIGLHNALCFAVGSDVLAPWLEVRAEDGCLIRRFLFSLGKHRTESGFGAFTKANEFGLDSSLAVFLQAFFATSVEKRQSLIVPLNLIRSGSPGASNIEDSISDLVKALDNLCITHGFIAQQLLDRLDAGNQMQVKAILDETRSKLLTLRLSNKGTGKQGQLDVLDSIISRLANVSTKSREFGIAVKDLLMLHKLYDAEVLDRHYRGTRALDDGWAKLLSAVRGEVIHAGYLNIRDRRNLRIWFNFARHLHDLCKRIILREVNYAGDFQASNKVWVGQYSVDRIKPSMQASDLGLSDPPTHI